MSVPFLLAIQRYKKDEINFEKQFIFKRQENV